MYSLHTKGNHWPVTTSAFIKTDIFLRSLCNGKQCFDVRGRYLLLKSIGTSNNNSAQSLKHHPQKRLLKEMLSLRVPSGALRTTRVKAVAPL